MTKVKDILARVNSCPSQNTRVTEFFRSLLEPLLDEIESLSEHIREYNERVKQIAQESYPEVARLEQVKGVGTLISPNYMLTLEDPRRVSHRPEQGWCLGLRTRTRDTQE